MELFNELNYTPPPGPSGTMVRLHVHPCLLVVRIRPSRQWARTRSISGPEPTHTHACTHTHSEGQLTTSNEPNVHVFGVWKQTGVPREIPRAHRTWWDQTSVLPRTSNQSKLHGPKGLHVRENMWVTVHAASVCIWLTWSSCLSN